MARSTSTQANKPESSGNTTCEHCGVTVKRPADLPRHMLLHAPNKEEFMYTCPVEGCSHQTLQRSNLNTHIRTHTRTRPYECPEYHTNGQKCLFNTADPSSLHRHRKRKHGYKPRSMTAEASGSGTREKSVESNASFESEESFGLHPAASADADPGAGPASQPNATNPTSYSFVHVPYLTFTGGKASGYQHASPYYSPLDLKVPSWIGSPVHLPATFQSSVDCEVDGAYGNVLTSSAEISFLGSTSDVTMLQWPELVSQEFDATYLSFSSMPFTSAPVSTPLHFQQEFATFSVQAHPYQPSEFTAELVGFEPVPQVHPSYSSASLLPPVSHFPPLHIQQESATFSMQALCPFEISGSAAEPIEYLELPADLFPSRADIEQCEAHEWQ